MGIGKEAGRGGGVRGGRMGRDVDVDIWFLIKGGGGRSWFSDESFRSTRPSNVVGFLAKVPKRISPPPCDGCHGADH